MAERIVVHDPRGYPPKVVGKRLSPRLSELDGRTISGSLRATVSIDAWR